MIKIKKGRKEKSPPALFLMVMTIPQVTHFIELHTVGSSLPAMGQLPPAPAITRVPLLAPFVSHPAPPAFSSSSNH